MGDLRHDACSHYRFSDMGDVHRLSHKVCHINKQGRGIHMEDD